MGNFFEDHEDLQFRFERLDLARIGSRQEDGFDGGGEDSSGPMDAEDAIDNDRRILTIVRDVAANIIAPRAAQVDTASHGC